MQNNEEAIWKICTAAEHTFPTIVEAELNPLQDDSSRSFTCSRV
jgi:hypothetical protein